jgi:hypothetical protein
MGSATITATTRGQTISRVLRTIVSDPSLSDDLAVESFSVVEYAYRRSGSGDLAYEYAPAVTLRDPTGRGAEVYGVQFDTPGIGTTAFCAARRPIPAGLSIDLFHEIYGDYELSFGGDGRAASGPATAAIYFVNAVGEPGQVRVTGEVSPGSFPTTYSGGVIDDPWYCTSVSLP